ncbi:hypothetical protein DUI87_03906 [Hirundo rustica rustica]|uniref:Uncharacterized protein n=1 Tax=Hirundo rustica rustica TaxID=333673 RepID=A0A3M0L1B6_HIRRU|nr:hypothetical protein DUI87_03906 [Hirundo rustica rustica]
MTDCPVWVDVGEDEAKKPYKYDCLDSENEKPVSEIELKPDGSFQPYSKIKQLPSEPFVTFVERLAQAIELQVKNEGAQEPVLEEMALTNANQQCKAAILSLPTEPVPTLDDMLHIPLHPDDAPCFAFSVPTLNQEAPRKRYHWKFLPQGMKNSPSVCQWYLSSLLSPVHAAVGEAIILHYVDDVLVCAPNDDLLSHTLDLTIDSLVAAVFELQEEKIQRMPPWKYLGLEIDSAYVAGVVSRAEQAVLSEVSNSTLFNLISKLVNLISHREQQFYVMHIRSHTDLPGFIADGNRRADALAVPVEMAPLPDIFGQAKISHELFHQNAPGLVPQFHLTREQARAIVAMCPSCQQHALPALSAGANPRALKSCEVWQTDVTHIMSFGRQGYVHVSAYICSGAVYASANSGEKSSDAMKHLIQAFSFLGIPKSIKTDNGPTYTSKEFRSFLQQWGAEHKTGIPYSPTGQAIVERTHQNLKRVLSQQHQSLN